MQRLTLKAVRVNSGKSIEEAAMGLGISKNTLSNYESGKTSPNVTILKKILAYYNISFDNVLFI